MIRVAPPALLCLVALLTGCHLAGRPGPGVEVPRPEQVTSFDQLYAQNCAGCHGADGQNGPATDLANPEYLALVDDTTLHDIVANGESGTLMPAFATSSGGTLSDAQIDDMIRGMRQRWAHPVSLGPNTPPYRATNPGNPTHGEAVYTVACARCHGPELQQSAATPTQSSPPASTAAPQLAAAPKSAAAGSVPGGSILDGTFLALINDQTVRTTILAGRPDLGQPDFRNLIPGRPLTDAEITDVTAWLIAQRPAHPGHPYPNTQPTSTRPGEAQPLSEINPHR